MTTELQHVELSERVYKYIRQFTIKSTEDALVELITNSVDAYRLKNQTSNRAIEIEYRSPGLIRVRDQAIGLTAEEMHSSFLQVGSKTSGQLSRGFFARGAKDISAIGNITFNSFKNGKYSQCYLNSDAYGQITIANVDATQEQRDLYLIPENGLEVVIELLPNFYVSNPSNEAESLSKLGVLRDIMQDSSNLITYSHFSEIGEVLFSRRLEFSYPPGTEILDLEYIVPNYPGYRATFKVYQAHDPMPQPKKENEMIFGFLIRDSTSVYEVSTIDERFRWDPYINRIYGSLTCEHIHDLLLEYDSSGATTQNPMPIIDPSRLTGINRQHPFIDALLSIPKVRIDGILHELNHNISEQSVSLAEASQLLDELEKYGLDIVENEEINVSFTPDYSSHLAQAIEDDRYNYVTKEKTHLMTRNFNVAEAQFDRYVQEQLIKIAPEEGQQFVVNVDGTPSLIHHKQADQEPSVPQSILELVTDDQLEALQQRPYIYSLSKDGDLVKLYIFEKGILESIEPPEENYIKIKNKKFNISFINDINVKSRYVLEYSDGVHIKLNMANDVVKKYLTTDNVQHGITDLSISNVTSVTSLNFMKELMIEILSQVIMENEILNGKIILDGTSFSNAKKINTRKNEIVTRIEQPMEIIFGKYTQKNKITKVQQIAQIIDTIGGKVGELVDLETQGSELYYLKDQLNNLVQLTIE